MKKQNKIHSELKVSTSWTTDSIKINRPGYNISIYKTNFWQPAVHVQQNIFEKTLLEFVVHIYALLLAPFASTLVNFSRHSEALNIWKNGGLL